MSPNDIKYEILKLLLDDNIIDPNARDKKGMTAFYHMTYANQYNLSLEKFKLLLNDPRIDMNIPDNDGITPFMIACKNWNYMYIKLMIESGKLNDVTNKNKILKLMLDKHKYDVFELLYKTFGDDLLVSD